MSFGLLDINFKFEIYICRIVKCFFIVRLNHKKIKNSFEIAYNSARMALRISKNTCLFSKFNFRDISKGIRSKETVKF